MCETGPWRRQRSAVGMIDRDGLLNDLAELIEYGALVQTVAAPENKIGR